MRIGIKIFILVLCAGSVLAQPKIHLGLTTSANSTFVLDKGLSENYTPEMNIKWAPVGVSFGVDFTKRFGLQLESIRAAQGQIYQMIDQAQAVQGMIAERNIDLNYLQFPLLLKMMSGGGKAARFNFQAGPQVSLLQKGVETLKFVQSAKVNLENGGDISIEDAMVLIGGMDDIPVEYQEAIINGTMPPLDPNNMEIPLEFFQDEANPGEYLMPENAMMSLMNSEVESRIQKFKDKEIQIAFGFGMDIDVGKNFYISTNVRGNYSFTDMRNEDLINHITANDLSGILGRRANLLVGAQIGLHWMIGGNRSFMAKNKEEGKDKDSKKDKDNKKNSKKDSKKDKIEKDDSDPFNF